MTTCVNWIEIGSDRTNYDFVQTKHNLPPKTWLRFGYHIGQLVSERFLSSWIEYFSYMIVLVSRTSVRDCLLVKIV